MGVEGILSIHCQSVESEEIRVLAIGGILYGWKCERNEFSPYIMNQFCLKMLWFRQLGKFCLDGLEWNGYENLLCDIYC